MNRDTLKQEPSGDLISREETLTAFADYVGSGMSMDDYDALWDIVAKMPPVNPQPCEDAISRQAALDCFTATKLKKFDFILYAREEIKKLPPVNPTKTGHWIDTNSKSFEFHRIYKCSECGNTQIEYPENIYRRFRYCPNCGCRMVESQESEVSE